MSGEPDPDDEPPGLRLLDVSQDEANGRVDKLLAAGLADLSRGRIQALIAEGRVTRDGVPVTDGSAKAQAGTYRLEIPPPTSAIPLPEAIPLTVLYEDAYLIVIDKPPGIAMHPAPGSETGTVVNAAPHFAVNQVDPFAFATTRPPTHSAMPPSATVKAHPSPSTTTVCPAPTPNSVTDGGYTAGAAPTQTAINPTANFISSPPPAQVPIVLTRVSQPSHSTQSPQPS